MPVIWISYELRWDSEESYMERYTALVDAIDKLGTTWDKTTSFVLVETNLTCEQVAARLKKKVDPEIDLILVGSMTVQGVATVGLMPNLPRLRRLCPGGLEQI